MYMWLFEKTYVYFEVVILVARAAMQEHRNIVGVIRMLSTQKTLFKPDFSHFA